MIDSNEEMEWRELVDEYETKWREALAELVATREALVLARAENMELKEKIKQLEKGL